MSIERLSTGDLAMLVPDETPWKQDIAAVGLLEGASLFDARGVLRIDSVRQAIERRLSLAARFRQLLVDPPIGLGMPYWTDAPDFDIADHVRVMPLPAGAGEPELLAAFETIRARAFDRSRPLWEVWLLPNLASGNVGLVIKVHHTVADGIAGVATFAKLLAFSPSPVSSESKAWQPQPAPSKLKLFVANARQRLHELLRPLIALLHLMRTWRMLRKVAPTARSMLADRKAAPRTSLARVVGTRRRIALVRSRLDVLKAIGYAHGAKVNDVLLAIIASGLRTLLLQRGENVDGLVLRAMVPIAMHPDRATAQGNRDAAMFVPLPIGDGDDVARLVAIAHDTTELKKRPHAPFGGASFPGIRTMFRWLYRGMPKQRYVNTYVANVPGPPAPVYLAGAKLLEIFPVVPLTGNTPLCAGALSYAGKLAITIVWDPDACPDAEVFVAAMRRALDALAREAQAPSAAA